MSLRNSFYYIIERNETGFIIGFEPSHAVFQGHFPGHPIVPGACLVQIAQELMALTRGSNVQLTAIRNLKFRQPVTPDMQVRYTLQNDKVSIENLDATDTYAQFAATYMCSHSDVQQRRNDIGCCASHASATT